MRAEDYVLKNLYIGKSSIVLFQDPEHPRNLIPELLQQFYHLDWVTGTGGGISIKHGSV